MTWFFAAFLSAFFIACRTVYDKHLFTNLELCYRDIAFRTFLVPAVLMAFPAFYFQEYVHLTQMNFILPTLGNVTFNILAFFLYSRLMKSDAPSTIQGFKVFEPALISITAFIFLGEFLSPLAVFGIGIIALGCWILEHSRQKDHRENGGLKPTSLFLIFIMILLTVLATTCSKGALNAAGGDIFVYISTRYTLICAFFFAIRKKQSAKTGSVKDNFHLNKIFLSGLMVTLFVAFEMYALTLTNVAYVEAIRQLSLPIILIMESFLFYNRFNLSRIAAVFILLFGALIVSLANGT